MKTKAIYSGILSIMLFMSFFSDAKRTRIFESEAKFKEAIQKRNSLPQSDPLYRLLDTQLKTFRTNNPELARLWAPKEVKTESESDILDNNENSSFLNRDAAREVFQLRVSETTGIAREQKAETIEVLAEFTSLSKEQIKEILESRNDEAVDQIRQLAIHVKTSRESVDPQTINTLVELAYTMRNRERQASSRQNYTPGVNVMLSLVRNIASMATTWAVTPRTNALKLVAEFNHQYKVLKAQGRTVKDGIVSLAVNQAISVAEGIKKIRDIIARKTEIDVLCRQ